MRYLKSQEIPKGTMGIQRFNMYLKVKTIKEVTKVQYFLGGGGQDRHTDQYHDLAWGRANQNFIIGLMIKPDKITYTT